MSVVPPNRYERKSNINFGQIGSAVANILSADDSAKRRQAEQQLVRGLKRKIDRRLPRTPSKVAKYRIPETPPHGREGSASSSAFRKLKQGIANIQSQQANAFSSQANMPFRRRRMFRTLRGSRPSFTTSYRKSSFRRRGKGYRNRYKRPFRRTRRPGRRFGRFVRRRLRHGRRGGRLSYKTYKLLNSIDVKHRTTWERGGFHMFWENANLNVASIVILPIIKPTNYDTMFTDMLNNTRALNADILSTNDNFIKVFPKSIQRTMQFTNVGLGCCEITMWMLWPRKDVPNKEDDAKTQWPAGDGSKANQTWDYGGGVTGNYANNLMFNGPKDNTNAMVLPNSLLWGRAPTLTPREFTPYMSNQITSLFKIKYKGKKMLTQGKNVIVKWTKRGKRLIDRSSFGLTDESTTGTVGSTAVFTSTVANYWAYLRNHPLLCVRVTGCVTHDKRDTYAGNNALLTVTGGADANLGVIDAPTGGTGTGPFNVQVFPVTRIDWSLVPIAAPRKYYFAATGPGLTDGAGHTNTSGGTITVGQGAEAQPVAPMDQGV